MKRRFGLLISAFVALLLTCLPHVPSAGAQDLTQSSISVSVGGMNAETRKESKASCSVDLLISGCVLVFPENGPKGIFASLLLPYCAGESDSNCIESLDVFNTHEGKGHTELIGEAPGIKVEPLPEIGLPRGGGPSIFKSNVKHSGGGNTYAAIASAWVECEGEPVQCSWKSLEIIVQPFISSAKPLDYKSGTKFDFLPDTAVSLSVRVPKTIPGWFAGKFSDPNISVLNVEGAAQQQRISFEGSAIVSQKLSAQVPTQLATPLMKKYNMAPGPHHIIASDSRDAIAWAEELRNFVDDKSSADERVWQVKAIWIYFPYLGYAAKCYKTGQVNGVVSSNALAYDAEPPKFQDGYLDYTMAGLHFSADGTIALGKYDLIVNSDLARCIYGFTSAPISATIQILADGRGSETVAVSSLAEKDGWLKFAAHGFTFSTKTARIRMEQNSGVNYPPSSSTSTTPNPAIAPLKKIITCVRGKSVRKVSAIKPVCPKGWKLKRK